MDPLESSCDTQRQTTRKKKTELVEAMSRLKDASDRSINDLRVRRSCIDAKLHAYRHRYYKLSVLHDPRMLSDYARASRIQSRIDEIRTRMRALEKISARLKRRMHAMKSHTLSLESSVKSIAAITRASERSRTDEEEHEALDTRKIDWNHKAMPLPKASDSEADDSDDYDFDSEGDDSDSSDDSESEQ